MVRGAISSAVVFAQPSEGPAGATLNVTFTGSNTSFEPGKTTIAFSDPGITVTNVTVLSETELVATVNIDPATASGFKDVTITSDLGDAFSIVEGLGVFEVTGSTTAPQITGITPSDGSQGEILFVTINGFNTNFSSSSTVSFGSGITVNSVEAVSSTELVTEISIDPAAVVGFRSVQVTTGSEFASLGRAFLVTVPNCKITDIVAGEFLGCDPATETYSQEVIVSYIEAPETGDLVVNGQSFPITGSPQTVVLTGLEADANPVNVTATFSDDAVCTFVKESVFTAAEDCSFVTVWDGSSWSKGEPDETLLAVIDANFTTDKSYVSKGLTVSSGAVLNVQSSSSWDAQGDVIVNGTLNVKSGGSFLSYDAFAFNGAINYERKTSFSTSTPKYSVVSTPITQATTSDIGSYVLTYDEPSDSYSRYKGELDVTGGYFSAFTGDVSFTGVPNMGTLTTPPLSALKTTQNVLGNPYTAAINVEKFMAANSSNIAGTIGLWNHKGSGGFLLINSLGQVSGGDQTGITFNGHIGAVQGFLVLALTDGAQVTFTEDMRVTGENDDDTFLRFTKNEKVDKSIRIKLALEGDEKVDETLVGLVSDATDFWDKEYDANKILSLPGSIGKSGNKLLLYSLLDDDPMAIQGLPQLDNVFTSKGIDLGLIVPKEGEYSVSIKDQRNLKPGVQIYLEDQEVKTMHDLLQSAYDFETVSGQSNDRFKLWIGEIVDENKLGSEFRYYGADNEIKLWSNSLSDVNEVEVYDINGRLVSKKHDFDNDVNELNFYVPEKGIYILSISKDHQKVIQKVLVK